MTDAFKQAGYDASLINDQMRVRSLDVYNTDLDSDFTFETIVQADSRIVNLEMYDLSGKFEPGATKTQTNVFTVSVHPSDAHASNSTTQIRLNYTITLTII